MKTQWTKSSRDPRPKPIDPYYDWALATNFAYYGKPKWLPVLLELHKPLSKQFAQHVFAMDNNGWAGLIRIPEIYRTPPARVQLPTRFLTAMVKREFLTRLYAGDDPSSQIKRFELGRAATLPQNMGSNTGWGVGKPGKATVRPLTAVTGVIDDGIAFAHERFRDGPVSTRVHYFWDQVAPSVGAGEWDYGNEICKHDTAVTGIDNLLAACRHPALVDEDELYRISGHINYAQSGHKPAARRIAHGTHVMDLACNALTANFIGPIIAVQLPTATTEDTSGATLSPQVYDALMYMLDRADKIAAANSLAYLPLAVNLSYGLVAGPHDGTGMVEQMLDELIASCNLPHKKPLLQVVLPAGNHHLARCHARLELKPGKAGDLLWRVQPDDWTESFLEIWYPAKGANGAPTDLEVTVTTPSGDTTLPFGDGTTYNWGPAATPLGQVDFYSIGGRKLVKVSLAPTAWPDGALALAPAGLWRVSIKNIGKGKVAIDAWIQRDDTPYGYSRRGRQSYFDDPAYSRYDCRGRAIEDDAHAETAGSYVKRDDTINAIATGNWPVVVAGIRGSDWQVVPYSASGPAVPPGRGGVVLNGVAIDGPDAMSICDDTPSHNGILAAGTRSGSCVTLRGTSVSAPQIARWVAGELAAGRIGDRKSIVQFASGGLTPPIFTERNPPPGAVTKPVPKRGGAGRIEPPEVVMPSPRRRRFER